LNSAASAAPPPCPAGAGQPCDWAGLGTFIDRSGKVGVVTVEQCRRCGHGRSLPPLADVAFLYDGRESQDFQPHNRGLTHRIKAIAMRREARRLLRQVGAAPEARILDFGCGSGQFTRELGSLRGPGGVTGADFFPAPPPDLADRPYVSHEDLATLGASFDVVLAMHVLEHDADPAGLIGRIVAPLRPGGVAVIEVPNISCVWARVFGRFWDGWYLPFHRVHFSRASLAAVLEWGGVEVLAIHPAVVPTMGRTLANLCGKENALGWLLAGIVLHPLQLLGEWLGREPSGLRAIVRKPAG